MYIVTIFYGFYGQIGSKIGFSPLQKVPQGTQKTLQKFEKKIFSEITAFFLTKKGPKKAFFSKKKKIFGENFFHKNRFQKVF